MNATWTVPSLLHQDRMLRRRDLKREPGVGGCARPDRLEECAKRCVRDVRLALGAADHQPVLLPAE